MLFLTKNGSYIPYNYHWSFFSRDSPGLVSVLFVVVVAKIPDSLTSGSKSATKNIRRGNVESKRI